MHSAEHKQKLDEFVRLHRAPGAFLMPNTWDAGTARILEGMGFPALATTSAGLAFSMGLRDSSGSLSRRQIVENARSIVEATSLPVSADLENGFGASPEDCAQTVREAAAVGLCGGAIEDATGDPSDPIYDFELAVERIRAAVESRPTKNFLITARAENFIYGRPDLGDTIRRLKAFEQSGADVVYAPGLPDIECVRAVCEAVTVPVNVVVGLSATTYTVDDLSKTGVRRISTGGSLARAALGEMIRAAEELKDCGTYGYADKAVSDATAANLMKKIKQTTV
ncbi:isocitrate lyase/phosphoenolpyruvate mutase family protein [Roseicyclus sp. F158]|uniref:Isocitrate lyase/phosphoenolpyruvate mutase family protein n=1 Tax=Tropicimonas omnivorans TaxID=3075590 RepID=A0ABU3DKF7_9RHOB|nr:isocitrate lyase/phosphoenolpyruvate mutase family protein [Roseicyclus sp. F158]MDT0684196.1 isocitrate lyase/phosphoenolpyruvate mutase family protein [Roseicyclus sp. F158]